MCVPSKWWERGCGASAVEVGGTVRVQKKGLMDVRREEGRRGWPWNLGYGDVASQAFAAGSLEAVCGSVTLGREVPNVSVPRLREVTGKLTIHPGADGQGFNFPALESVGNLTFFRNVSMPQLREVTGKVAAHSLAVDFPALERVGDGVESRGSVVVSSNLEFVAIDLSRLESVGGSVVIQDNAGLEEVRLPALESVEKDVEVGGAATWIRGGTRPNPHMSIRGYGSIGRGRRGRWVERANPNLRTLALSSLSSVGQDLLVTHNPALEVLTFRQCASEEGECAAPLTVGGRVSVQAVGGKSEISSLTALRCVHTGDRSVITQRGLTASEALCAL
uniref:Receptor L-domain domain-containing protein n=1 Tax=Chromera velia CCMP2878 TaxID=1169474 RepID=A0A0G4HK83_9ALVE|eukprot:Cvel_7172.t1-p1 / transcript=Cvel_7172.t1 / gene=Cvel_7172 / organism=Chromera_velia_CCMP2878 / gene_product=hypothetical protein / transcript_product=hypothetical protein / location=Cvel_scaffold369:29188-30493(+) / protein_length=333 / sequence_SO=supercontig / SO=protein_coding / is_pseudo=false